MKRKIQPKFTDCTNCRFFSRRVRQPICGECGCGEFFEVRVRGRAPTDDELMSIYRKDYQE